MYRIKIKTAIILIVLTVFFLFNPRYGECIEKSRREKWPVLKSAIATIGKQKFKVYYDPKNPSHIFIYQGCWLIRREAKKVVVPNCVFELDGGTLYYDKTWRNPDGHLEGVEWGDPKMDNISLFSSIFRKPKFNDTSVSLWNGTEWIYVTGLSKLDESKR
jgi:hypothetical protein